MVRCVDDRCETDITSQWITHAGGNKRAKKQLKSCAILLDKINDARITTLPVQLRTN